MDKDHSDKKGNPMLLILIRSKGFCFMCINGSKQEPAQWGPARGADLVTYHTTNRSTTIKLHPRNTIKHSFMKKQ